MSDSIPGEIVPGARIRIVAGLFEGHEAVVTSFADKTLLAEARVFGRTTPVELCWGQIEGVPPASICTLPTQSDFDPYGGDLDARYAWTNFGGLTPNEATAKFRECPMTYQEDFMFMGPKAFVFYFPVIETFLFETKAEEADEYDDRQAWILSHCILAHFKKDRTHVQHLAQRVLDLAKFVQKNVGSFVSNTDEQHKIEAAWQELYDYVSTSAT